VVIINFELDVAHLPDQGFVRHTTAGAYITVILTLTVTRLFDVKPNSPPSHRRRESFIAYTMAESSVQNQNQSRRAAHPNRGRRRPHRRGGEGGAKSTHAASSSSAPNANATTANEENVQDDPAAQTQTDSQQDTSEEQDLCWICAEPIKYYAVSECNHRTCHVCALRLRALYKKLDCTFCKVRVASASCLAVVV
jgi:hypothetical protein